MRYLNSGKDGDRVLRPDGYDAGTAIVNFPEHGFRKVVAAGERVDVPDAISADMIKALCPSLVSDVSAEVAPTPRAAPVASDVAKDIPAVEGKE